jgi:cell fate regulator YaaT (PSP1 superfamily)
MSQSVKVRLRKPRRVFTFLCPDTPLRRDEPCIVQTERGPEWGVCILPPEPLPQEMEDRMGGMRVLRKANEQDAQTLEWMIAEEKRSYEICRDRIIQHGLAMKLADVEVSFDKRKVIFLFTADDRIDFRELVRDLAHDLRTRIEMRHIQVRDEAGMVGGLGGCGRELCCSTWLTEFKPISMRMAKNQNLSLNPSKISGQCGRLLCCLAYENDQYEQVKRKKREPRIEQTEPQRPPRRALPEPGAGDYDAPAYRDSNAPAPQARRDERPRQDRDRPQQDRPRNDRDRPQQQDRPRQDRDRPQQERAPQQDRPRQERPRQEERPGPDDYPQQDERPRQEPRVQAQPENRGPEQQPPVTPSARPEGEAPKKRRGGRSRRRGGGPAA